MNEILIINLQILSPSGFNNATEDISYSFFYRIVFNQTVAAHKNINILLQN